MMVITKSFKGKISIYDYSIARDATFVIH